ncbi:hypothetical protein [Streptomyces cavernae]|uniref:hypothetical protein n=1 Tax=Streptomyces cavernae TaxID=2259034 RepID=UPI00139165E4|nr:hypothetical protein [Streptomyces cavernae]
MNRTAFERRVRDHLGDASAAEQRRTRDELVAYGPLLSDGTNWLGTAVLVRAARIRTWLARFWLPAGTPTSKSTTGSSAGGRHDRFRTPVVIRSLDAAWLSGGPSFSR